MDFLLYGLVLAALVGSVLFFGWVFNRYALMETYHFLKVMYGVGAAAVVIFVTLIVDAYYPLTILRIGVPAFFCAIMLHCLILLSMLHVKQTKNRLVPVFKQRIMIGANYLFFGMVSLFLMHFESSTLDLFFYYLTEGGIKLGLCVMLYLLLKINESFKMLSTQDNEMINHQNESHFYN